MKRIARFALVGGLTVCLVGAVALAAGNDKAKVSDLVGAIAAKHGVKTSEVVRVLETRQGRKLDLDATLDQGTAAGLLNDLGLSGIKASRGSSPMSISDINALGSLIAVARLSAQDNGGGDGHDDGEANNRGRKTRPKGQTPNSNADINAFESLRDDPRD
jgi:hypothetical protein